MNPNMSETQELYLHNFRHTMMIYSSVGGGEGVLDVQLLDGDAWIGR